MPVKHTSEIVTELARLASIGYSASQAASQFNGMTRNSAVGIAHRHAFRFFGGRGGGDHRNATAKSAFTRAKRAAKFRTIEVIDPLPSAQMEPLLLTFDELENGDCRFAYGMSDFRFCGLPALEGRSWCRKCSKIVYSQPGDR